MVDWSPSRGSVLDCFEVARTAAPVDTSAEAVDRHRQGVVAQLSRRRAADRGSIPAFSQALDYYLIGTYCDRGRYDEPGRRDEQVGGHGAPARASGQKLAYVVLLARSTNDPASVGVDD